MKKRGKAYLVLSDGTVYEGLRFGAASDGIGELVFTTGMCGYLETLTDPSYAGQIVMQTFPLIGNYGVIPPDFEGECKVRGYVVRELCETPSNFRSEGELESFLIAKNIPGICGVDTRQITRIIREYGVMNAVICSKIPKDLTPVKNYAVRGVVADCSTDKPLAVPAAGTEKYTVTLIDYGAKKNISRELSARGCRVTIVPQNTSAADILAGNPDGVMLSNGPGDPEENADCVAQLKKLIGKVPVFGICLGHQLTALAMGGRTYKLKYGHRGVNQPVRDVLGTRTFITSQNHGYAVDGGSLDGVGRVIFSNANDGTCEGLEYPGKSCFTVQFHPEAASGPHDTGFLFDKFIAMMEDEKNAKR